MTIHSFHDEGGHSMNISDQLSLTAQQQPDKAAYIFQDKETSYQELEGAVTKFASSLQQLGYGKGDHIALVVGNSPFFVIGLYGALRIGATVIPINPIYTVDEISYILKNGDVKGVITMDVLLEKFEHMDAHIPGIRHYFVGETGGNPGWEQSSLSEKMKSFTKTVCFGAFCFVFTRGYSLYFRNDWKAKRGDAHP